MATHSNILAWRIPLTEEPGGLRSMESQRVGHSLETEHACMCPKWVFSLGTLLGLLCAVLYL